MSELQREEPNLEMPIPLPDPESNSGVVGGGGGEGDPLIFPTVEVVPGSNPKMIVTEPHDGIVPGGTTEINARLYAQPHRRLPSAGQVIHAITLHDDAGHPYEDMQLQSDDVLILAPAGLNAEGKEGIRGAIAEGRRIKDAEFVLHPAGQPLPGERTAAGADQWEVAGVIDAGEVLTVWGQAAERDKDVVAALVHSFIATEEADQAVLAETVLRDERTLAKVASGRAAVAGYLDHLMVVQDVDFTEGAEQVALPKVAERPVSDHPRWPVVDARWITSGVMSERAAEDFAPKVDVAPEVPELETLTPLIPSAVPRLQAERRPDQRIRLSTTRRHLFSEWGDKPSLAEQIVAIEHELHSDGHKSNKRDRVHPNIFFIQQNPSKTANAANDVFTVVITSNPLDRAAVSIENPTLIAPNGGLPYSIAGQPESREGLRFHPAYVLARQFEAA